MLVALLALNLQGNLIEELENFSFLGLLSLTTLDLSNNNILILADESLTGLPSLETLFLSHNHLQVVSGLWLVGTPLLMDNDITNVAEDAFAGLENAYYQKKRLKKINVRVRFFPPKIEFFGGLRNF